MIPISKLNKSKKSSKPFYHRLRMIKAIEIFKDLFSFLLLICYDREQYPIFKNLDLKESFYE
jgi:hypothetical protein